MDQGDWQQSDVVDVVHHALIDSDNMQHINDDEMRV